MHAGQQPSAPFRCSAASRARDEPLEGSASTVRAFLLVEVPGPWGVDAVRESRMDEVVRDRLVDLERRRVRPLLVRRHGRTAQDGPRRVFAAWTGGRPWVETGEVHDLREVLELDLERVAAGESVGLRPHDDPVYLVCTHGRHDACCAETGRPFAGALAALAPAQTWEVSHIGGDRFAGNALVLPHGLYYGRLRPEDAPALVEAHGDGRLDLEHLRGRSSYPFAVQAAEIRLRRHLAETRLDAVVLEDHSAADGVTTARFRAAGAGWRVRVRTDRTEPTQLTCRATRPSGAMVHTLLDITPA